MNQSENERVEFEINLKEMFQTLWEEKKRISYIILGFFLFSILYSLFLTNYYQSESLLQIRSQSTASSQISQIPGLSNMGINLPPSGDYRKSKEAVEIIKSRALLKELLKHEGVLQNIMASERYDSSSKEIILNDELYDSKNKKWVREIGNLPKKPTYLEAYEVYLKGGLVSVSQDQVTDFISIKVEHISPIFAKELLELIILETNNILRERDLEEASKAISYLESELVKTNKLEIKESISKLMEIQMEKRMMAKVNEAYMLIEIEPPFIPEKKSSPQRTLIVLFWLFFGTIIATSYVILRKYIFQES